MTSAGPLHVGGVAFVNPNAAQARSYRRTKLAAARARIAATPANAGTISVAGAGGDASGIAGGEKEVRKQQRMLRNRESAALSRKRKSDRIGELEVQVQSLEDENRCLRQRIDVFEIGVAGTGADCSSDDLPATCTLQFSPRNSAAAGGTALARPAACFSSTTFPATGNFVMPPTGTPFATAAAAANFNIFSRPAVFA